MSTASLLVTGALGAVCGLDVVSFPQAMISRPIVAATAAGALGGNAMAGLLAGAALELMAMETLPVGAARYPEWGSASVVGGALAAAEPATHPGNIIIAAFVAIAMAWVGGWSMHLLRRWNGARSARALPALEAGRWRALAGLQLGGLAADLLRGGVLTIAGLLVWHPITDWLLGRWTVPLAASHGVLAAIAAAVAGSSVWLQARTVRGTRWYFLGGLVLGFAALVLL